ETPPRELVRPGRELLRQILEPCPGALDRHLGRFADMQARDPHGERLGFQPIAVAFMAGYVGEISRNLLARPFAVGLAPAALEVAHHAFERSLGLVGAQAVVVLEPDRGIARAVEDRVAGLGREILPR